MRRESLSSPAHDAVTCLPRDTTLNSEASLLRAAFDTLTDQMALLTANGDIIAVNFAWTEFALASGALEGESDVGTNYPLDCERALGAVAEWAHAVGEGVRDVLAGREDSFALEYSWHGASSERWFRLLVRRAARPGDVAAVVTRADITHERFALREAERSAQGLEARLRGMVEAAQVARSAAERRMAGALRTSEQAVRALRRTEHRLSEQFTTLPAPMFLWEARGDDFVLVDVNDAAAPLTPLHWQGAIGRTATDIFPSGWPVRDDAIRCLKDGLTRQRNIAFDMPHGATRTFELTTGPQQPDRVVVHAVDITEQTRLASELRQAQKMEAVGQLAGGVAHDFNNLLTVITGHCEVLLDVQSDAGLIETDAHRQDALAIQKAAQRAAALTRQLLAFTRKQILQPRVLDLNIVVEQTNRLLQRLLGEDIKVIVSLELLAGHILADAGQIEQVLMNLILNARDAMPFGGHVSIATANAVVDPDSEPSHASLPRGSYVRLSVSDTGAGMSIETKARIFEPFFTTKEVGKGTGLGLSTVYGIVTQAGGYIVVDSEPGLGTTFDVYLPRVEGAVPRPVLARAGTRTARALETILLVEDDPAVRNVVRRVLMLEGYLVLEAVDGTVALGVLESHGGRIDAVVTDAVMPGMTGRTVLERARALRPDCKALLMSGYNGDEMTRRGINSDNVSFIRKPFTPTDFARQLRIALDS